MTAFNALVAELNALAALPDLAAVVDALFPPGQAETRELREIAVGLIADDPTIDAPSLVGELITAITQPEIPTGVQEVRIMSLHKSKGLSSPVTIIAGCINGLLPRAAKAELTPIEQQHYHEEQRRLFFVGITRVKADPANGKPGTLILNRSDQPSHLFPPEMAIVLRSISAKARRSQRNVDRRNDQDRQVLRRGNGRPRWIGPRSHRIAESGDGGGRRTLCHMMFRATLVAAYHNPNLRAVADRVRKNGNPHKIIIMAVARKPVVIATAP